MTKTMSESELFAEGAKIDRYDRTRTLRVHYSAYKHEELGGYNKYEAIKGTYDGETKTIEVYELNNTFKKAVKIVKELEERKAFGRTDLPCVVYAMLMDTKILDEYVADLEERVRVQAERAARGEKCSLNYTSTIEIFKAAKAELEAEAEVTETETKMEPKAETETGTATEAVAETETDADTKAETEITEIVKAHTTEIADAGLDADDVKEQLTDWIADEFDEARVSMIESFTADKTTASAKKSAMCVKLIREYWGK